MTREELSLRNKIYQAERALVGARENLEVWEENQKPNPIWDWLKNGDFNFDLVEPDPDDDNDNMTFC
jgi:hypothetical protein